MKILEISGCNLASIRGEFRIALDQPPFSRETLLAQDPEKALDEMVASLYAGWELEQLARA